MLKQEKSRLVQPELSGIVCLTLLILDLQEHQFH